MVLKKCKGHFRGLLDLRLGWNSIQLFQRLGELLAPYMENVFQVTKFFLKYKKIQVFFALSKMVQLSCGLLVLATEGVFSGP